MGRLLLSQAPTAKSPRWVLLIAFCSGAAALIFEALWFRQAGLLVGNTVWAAALVLAAFMLGMALGNGLGAWLGKRLQRVGIAISIAELAIGLSGVALIYAASQLSQQSGIGPTTLAGVLISSFMALLIPAMAMGLTLPLLLAPSATTQAAIPVGQLYAANTLGAVTGVLLNDAVFLPYLGISHAALVALSLNGVAAILAWRLHAAPMTTLVATSNSSRPRWPLLLAASCGLVLLGLETIWLRILLQFNQAVDSSFAWILAVVLSGLSIGAWLAALLLPKRSTPNLVLMLSLLLAAAVLGGYRLLSPDWVLATQATSLTRLVITTASLCLLPSVLSGALMVALANYFHRHNNNTSDFGWLNLANMTGAATGTVLAAGWLLPSLGMQTALLSLALGMASITMLIWLILGGTQSATLWAGLLAVSLSLFSFPFDRDRALLAAASEPYRQLDQAQVVAVHEGLNQTVQLLRQDFLGQTSRWRMVTDGYSMSASSPDAQRYMRLFAWLPAVWHPKLEEVLLISYGVGNTADAILKIPELKQLHVVDTAEEILAYSSLMHPENDPLQDPRTRTFIQDGRHYLRHGSQQYDLITAEPPPPRFRGVGQLYSQEYFQLLKRRLKPDGMVSYWLPVDQLTLSSSRAITQAFCHTFEHCSLWAGSNYNWILLGSRDLYAASRQNPGYPADARLFKHRPSAEDLADIGIFNYSQFMVTFLGADQQLRDWVGNDPMLTDNWPHRLEHHSPKDLRPYAAWLEPYRKRTEFLYSNLRTDWSHSIIKQQERAWVSQPILNNEINTSIREKLGLVSFIAREKSMSTAVLWLLGSDRQRQRLLGDDLHPGQEAISAWHLGAGALSRNEIQLAQKWWRQAADYGHPHAKEALLMVACSITYEASREDCVDMLPY